VIDRRRLVVFSAIVVAAITVVSAWAWLVLPPDARVPIHWGVDGQVNGWAPKSIGLFLVPALLVGVVAIFWAIPVIEPRRANIVKSTRAYEAIWISVVVMLAGIHTIAVAVALGATIDMTLVVFVGVGLLFIVIGNYLPKVRSNYLMGIRTPWTLTSERSWDLTHRAGGRLFVFEGLVFILLGFVRPSAEVLLVAMLGGIALMLVFLFAYSYRVWKADPAKRQI
jgi:uncharacterized membrane protein